MARTAIDYDTRTKSARAKLMPRPKPYFRQIGPGRTLGYVRTAGGPGVWKVRELVGGRYKVTTIGHADDVARADGRDVLTYDQALHKASASGVIVPAGKLKVSTAIENYLARLAASSKHAGFYRSIADNHIIPALGGFRVDRVTKTQIETWQAGLVRDDPKDRDARRRSQETANRILTILKAALNAAFADDANGIASDAAWRRVKPFRKVARAREDDLEPAQVRLLIAKVATLERSLADLIEAGYLTGGRLGELTAATVKDLDVGRRTLLLDGKTGPRVVSLSGETAAFLQRITKGKLPGAPLLPAADGSHWLRANIHRPLKAALKLAKLPSSVSFYTLRHAHISRAIEAGMPLSLIAENCGTSLLMIQRNYAKVLARTRSDVIQKTAPKLRRVK
jgi:integrase